MSTDTERAEFTDTIEEHLEALRLKFQEMELSQMRKGEMEARAQLDRAKKVVTRKREQALRVLQEARKGGGQAWTEMQAGLDSALAELTEAVHRARDDFDGVEREEDEGEERTA